jgi:hypothetical protein
MSDPVKLIRLRQAQNRLEYAQKQVEQAKPKSIEYRYVGYDAEQGKAIVSNGNDTLIGNRITNGSNLTNP